MCNVAAKYLLASKPQASNLQRVKDSSASSDMYSIMKYKEIGFSPGGISQKDMGLESWQETFYMIKMMPRIEIRNSESDILYSSSEYHIHFVCY